MIRDEEARRCSVYFTDLRFVDFPLYAVSVAVSSSLGTVTTGCFFAPQSCMCFRTDTACSYTHCALANYLQSIFHTAFSCTKRCTNPLTLRVFLSRAAGLCACARRPPAPLTNNYTITVERCGGLCSAKAVFPQLH